MATTARPPPRGRLRVDRWRSLKRLSPGRVRPRRTGPRRAGPARARPRRTRPRRTRPRRTRPRRTGPGRAVPDPAHPRRRRSLGGRERGRVDGIAEDVLLAAERDAVLGEVVLAARALERAGAQRVRELLDVRRRRRRREHRLELHLAAALRALGAAEPQTVLLEVALDGVRRQQRV